jgi:HD-GYP domain-containing protein (c-di-GMP phosphodiesterase class II)
MHSAFSYDILKNYDYNNIILEAVLHHHENYDGSGYPNNLKGNSIPIGARILRTCDVFAALVSERRYRSAFEMETAIELMIDEVKNFDMQIFLAFLQVVHSEDFLEMQKFINIINKKNKYYKNI